MKAITIKQPFASLIAEGIKDIENRTWPTKFRGRVLIHAGLDQKLDKQALDVIFTKVQLNKLLEKYYEYDLCLRFGPFGAIIGSVEIVDCVINHTSIWAEKSVYHGEVVEKVNGECEIIKPIYNWVLANPIKFPEPIPAKGKLSFWDYPYIIAETEEKYGPLFCHCQLPVSESNQVIRIVDHYECRYCGGIWYK